MVSNEQVKDWVRRSLENEELTESVVDIMGHSEIEGFLSEIIFVNVSATTKDNERKQYNLAVKYLKNNRKQIETALLACRVEFNIYNVVFPALKIFLFEKGIINEPSSFPECYGCFDSNTDKVIVMENLINTGYELHDKKEHLNMKHLKEVLKEYGKFHAISFAYRDQQPKLFDELVEFLIDNDIIKLTIFESPDMRHSLKNNLDTALETLKKNGDEVLYNKLRQTFSKHPVEVIDDILKIEELQTAICHGDCWNNNFMFKYKDDDRTRPQAVKIIDWQLSGVRSPVFDLSYFLYSSGSQEEFERFDELLEYYYQSFSTFLLKMGSNPQELFTFPDLKRHWRLYGISGVIASLNALKIQLSDEIPDVHECDDITETAVFDLPLNDMELYYSRLRAIVSHYFSVVE